MRLVVLGFIFGSMLLSGCGCKTPTKVVIQKELVKAPHHPFTKVDLTGAFIELGSVEERKVCTPALSEMRDVYVPVLKYYDWQIDEYDKGNK